jgi:hypothetical protein
MSARRPLRLSVGNAPAILLGMITSRLVRSLCVALAVMLATSPLAAQAAAQQAAKLRPAMDAGKLKAMLINVPTGSPLRVRTRDGAEVAGKLTQLTNDGIQVQALANGNVEDRTFAFGDIAGLKTGARKTGFMSKLSPLLTIASLAGTVGAITAAVKKK